MAVKSNLKTTPEKKAGFPIPAGNYKMILIGFGIIVLGFILMMGGAVTIRMSLIMPYSVSGELLWLRLSFFSVSVLYFGLLCGSRRKRKRRKIDGDTVY